MGIEIKDILDALKVGGGTAFGALCIWLAVKYLFPAYINQVNAATSAQERMAEAAGRRGDACEERMASTAQAFAEQSQRYVDSMEKIQEQANANWRTVTAAMIDVVRSQERLADRIESLGDRRK